MGQTVLKCSRTTVEKMKQFYRPYIQDKKPQASEFFAKPPGCTITAYRSGKVLFQGTNAEGEAEQWKHDTVAAAKQQRMTSVYDPPENIESLSVIGSDEVGTGDYFGPVTVVAAFVGKNQLASLGQIGLKDSKLLTDWQIHDLAEQIKPKVTYQLLTLHNPKYNTLRDGGMTQGKMKAMLHNQALRLIIRKLAEPGISYDAILIDQFAKPDVYYQYLNGQRDIVRDRVYFRTQAESLHISVAAAAVIARQAFLREMDHLSEKAGMDLPKGAGAQVDETAARIIREKGVAFLRNVAKVHFANTEKAKHLNL